jgi:Zn-dependent protease
MARRVGHPSLKSSWRRGGPPAHRRFVNSQRKVVEYLVLFLIVLLHEFGHALACRQVGGTANRIVLWPLGGVAYVDPPPRPGATLWSLAAGPLVNVALAPVLMALVAVSRAAGGAHAMPNLYELLRSVLYIDVVLLVFNMLPIYPLDGGQIVRSLLWFVMGRARSLMVATLILLVVDGISTISSDSLRCVSSLLPDGPESVFLWKPLFRTWLLHGNPVAAKLPAGGQVLYFPARSTLPFTMMDGRRHRDAQPIHVSIARYKRRPVAVHCFPEATSAEASTAG